MNEPQVIPPPVSEQPSWGLGDVAIGIGLASVLSGVALAVLIATGGPATDDMTAFGYLGVMVFLLSTWLGTGGWAWAASRIRGTGSLVRDYGLRLVWPADVWIGIGWGVLLLGANALSLLADAAGLDTSDAQDIFPPPTAAWHVGVAVLGAVVVTPIVEEIFFRGLLLRSLLKKGWSPATSAVVSSVIFGFLHGGGATAGAALAIAVTTLYGLGLAVLALRTQRLGRCIIAHAVLNGAAVLAFLAS